MKMSWVLCVCDNHRQAIFVLSLLLLLLLYSERKPDSQKDRFTCEPNYGSGNPLLYQITNICLFMFCMWCSMEIQSSVGNQTSPRELRKVLRRGDEGNNNVEVMYAQVWRNSPPDIICME